MKQKALKLTVTNPAGETIYTKCPSNLQDVGAVLQLHEDTGLLITLEVVEYEQSAD